MYHLRCRLADIYVWGSGKGKMYNFYKIIENFISTTDIFAKLYFKIQFAKSTDIFASLLDFFLNQHIF